MTKTRYSFWLFSLIGVSMLLASCGGGQQQGVAQPDYKTTKAMVLDIIQTDEAKKAVVDIMKDEKVQQEVVMNPETMRTTLIQSFAKPDNPQIKEAFQDPKFTGTLAKAMKDEQKKLMKDLMKDPEYQKMLIQTMKDPEFEKNMMDLMKSSAYRKQTMAVMKEALDSPLFEAEMVKLMVKAQEEAMKPKTQAKKQSGGDGESGGSGGDGGGGEGGGGGGGAQ
ncbi:spore germination lipoprotein GerD [Brevibacillus dissolubilis]|uniref:spore germination lipoprotein GerD n=1 Tax=Brevibacillus dissolubilis TaxID=1844116 RepID=UPI0011167E32|nr:spore germination lipoprotein GerD [Brevibacillus dissolubilis]